METQNNLPAYLQHNKTIPAARVPPGNIIGQNLRKHRFIHNWSMRQLADASGVSQVAIQKLELGYSTPRVDTLVKLGRALGIKPNLLLRKPRGS